MFQYIKKTPITAHYEERSMEQLCCYVALVRQHADTRINTCTATRKRYKNETLKASSGARVVIPRVLLHRFLLLSLARSYLFRALSL